MLSLLLLLSVITAAGKAITSKQIGLGARDLRSVLGQNCILYAVGLAVLLIAQFRDPGAIFRLSGYSLGLSLIFAGVMLFTQLTQMRAMTLGASSLTTLIYSCGFLIPTVFSAVVYDEPVSPGQILGVAVLLLSLYLIVDPRGGRKISPAWLLFSLLAMTGSGTTAALQKIHQRSPYAGELLPFLSLVFFWALVFSAVFRLILPRKAAPASPAEQGEAEGDSRNPSVSSSKGEPRWQRYLPAVLSGLCLSLLNLLNLYLAGKLPAIVQFPVYNIGNMILTGILGVILFRETHTRKQLIGFAIGCAGIAVIGIFT